MVRKYWILILILFWIGPSIQAQIVLPQTIMAKVKEKQLKVRWEPQSKLEWERSKKEGYTIEIYKEDGGLVVKENIKPLPRDQWSKYIEGKTPTMADFYNGAVNLIYADRSELNDLEEIVDSENKKEAVDSLQLGLVLYSSTYKFEICELSGLGYKTKLEDYGIYRIKVYVGTDVSSAQEITIKSERFLKATGIPKMDAEFGNRVVRLSFLSKEFQNIYFGYFIDISEDNNRYKRLNEMPFVNTMDDIEGLDEAFPIKHVDTLQQNYKTYWFRLKGMDYFGDVSFKFSTVSGYGFDLIRKPPIIYHTDQTQDNKGLIQWRADKKDERLIQEYQVHRADSMKGEFIPVMTEISPSDREVKIPLTAKKNYFKIVMKPKDGRNISSQVLYIMGQDLEPPETPTGFTGTIDTAGIVTLTWNKNKEDDLWGYKLFESNRKTDEFTVMTHSPIPDTIITDTINLRTIKKEIYYQMIAVDDRNNRSPFTEILTIELPDKMPPDYPVIRKISFDGKQILLEWMESGSDDVASYSIYKRDINNKDASWSLIQEFSVSDSLGIYIDEEFQYESQYAYIMTATDESGLDSEPSPYQKVFTKKPKALFKDGIKSIEVDINKKKKTAKIIWELKEKEKIKELMIYRGKSEKEVSLWKIIDPDPNYLQVENLKKKTPMFYFIKPIYFEGDLSKSSKAIKVEIK